METDRFKEVTLASERVFDGKLLKIDSLNVQLPAGGKSIREIVRHPGAVVAIVKDHAGKFVFVRQFRKPVESVLLEAVAGTLGVGEDPADCVLREVAEETGFEVCDCEALGEFYAAPGYTDEKLSAYSVRLTDVKSSNSPDDDESIETVRLDKAEFEKMVVEGMVRDAKTLAAWYLYKERAK